MAGGLLSTVRSQVGAAMQRLAAQPCAPPASPPAHQPLTYLLAVWHGTVPADAHQISGLAVRHGAAWWHWRRQRRRQERRRLQRGCW